MLLVKNKELIIKSFADIYKLYKQEKPNRVYLGAVSHISISVPILDNAIKYIADGDINLEDIYVFFDSSKANNGTDGVVITKDKIFYKDGLEDTIIYLKDLKECHHISRFFGDKIKFVLKSGYEYTLKPFVVKKEYREMVVLALNLIASSYVEIKEEDY